VQAAHSALEAGRELGQPGRISHLILLEAKSEEHLHSIAQDLTELGIRYHLFFEPDHNRGYTSLTTEPLFTKAQRKYFFRHKLYEFRAERSYGCKTESKLLEI
jgi:hypothetical protein